MESGIPQPESSDQRINELPADQEQGFQELQQTPSEPEKLLAEQVNGEISSDPKDEWVIPIREKIAQAQKDSAANPWGKLCIYRVPHYLQENEKKAFFPQIVSVGPYHHGEERLRQMDRHKWRAVDRILQRTDQDIKIYLDSMKELEEKARACYEGPIGMNSNEFVEMLVLDGCFLLEIFRGVAAEGFEKLGHNISLPQPHRLRAMPHRFKQRHYMLYGLHGQPNKLGARC